MTSCTPAQIERFKRQAKQLHRASSLSHSQALDQIANANGYGNWSLLMKHGAPQGAAQSNGEHRPAALKRTLAEIRSTVEGVAVLPDQAKAYFDSQWSAQSADAWSNLSNRQREFERAEFARGQRPNGSGFAARLSALYKENLTQRARTIAETLKKVHQDFDSPLGEGVDDQLREWGTAALAEARQALEDTYLRHLQRYGLRDIHPIRLEHAYARGQATVANLPARHLWELRNVPAMHPKRQTKEAPVTVNINNSGIIGAVQTGPGAAAHVQQQWIEGDTSTLQRALGELREALACSRQVAPESRDELVARVDDAVVELQREHPSTAKLVSLLSAIGAIAAFLSDAQPAYEVLKGLASALGIRLP